MDEQLAKRDLTLNSKTLIKELKSSKPNLPRIAENFEKINENRQVSSWSREEIDQEVFVNYLMAADLYNFAVNDLVKIIYWLMKSNYRISEWLRQKLDYLIQTEVEKITVDSWLKILTIYSSSEKFWNLRSFTILETFLSEISLQKSSDVVQAGLDLCKMENYKHSIWRNLFKDPLSPGPNLLSKLRIISFALKTEGQVLQRTNISEIISKAIETFSAETRTDLEKNDFLNDIPYLSVSKLHREVEFVLKSIFKYQENYNIENTFILDFYNTHENIGIDLHGPLHYFFPDLGDKHDSMTERRLLPILKLKQRLLTKNGINSFSVPYYQWQRYPDNFEKILYLKRKLRLARLR